jgi:glycosyltransferase involved in cell wall biosynthesis
LLSGATVVCLSPIPWSGLWTSRHELAREMAERGAEVVFVDPPVNAVRPTARAESTRPIPPGMRVVGPPPYIPYGVAASVPAVLHRIMRINARRYAAFVGKEVTEGSTGRLVILLNSFMPVHGFEVASALKPDFHVYHRADEIRSFDSCVPAYIEAERRVLREADAVVCVSEAVRDGIATDRPDAVVIPNGVDNRRFVNAAPDARVASLRRPVAIVIGTVDDRVDGDLLDDVTSSGVTLVVAGQVKGVRLPEGTVALGPVEPSVVPGLLAGADAGLIPYRPGWPGDVLKAYEYLAAGLPVVSTPLSCLDEASLVVQASRPGFAGAVVAAISHDNDSKRARRREVAQEHDWARRVDDLLDLISVRA